VNFGRKFFLKRSELHVFEKFDLKKEANSNSLLYLPPYSPFDICRNCGIPLNFLKPLRHSQIVPDFHCGIPQLTIFLKNFENGEKIVKKIKNFLKFFRNFPQFLTELPNFFLSQFSRSFLAHNAQSFFRNNNDTGLAIARKQRQFWVSKKNRVKKFWGSFL